MRPTIMTYVPMIATTAILAGCGRGDLPDANYDGAREALVAALDAWKEGKVRELPRRTPPIRFADEDQYDGCTLQSYEFANPEAEIRPYQNIAVHLVLRNVRGVVVRKDGFYQVALEPAVAVLRSE